MQLITADAYAPPLHEDLPSISVLVHQEKTSTFPHEWTSLDPFNQYIASFITNSYIVK